MPWRTAVYSPTGDAELLVDQEARRRLVELDLLCLPVGELRQEIELLWWARLLPQPGRPLMRPRRAQLS